MSHGIATIHVRRQRKKMTVTGMGQTNRGQKYIKETVELLAPEPSDKNFKKELAAAVFELLGETPPGP